MQLNKSNDQLAYIVKDCYAAIAAYPMGYKVPEYFNYAKACEIELNRREGVKINRDIIKQYGVDGLSGKGNIKMRIRWRPSTYNLNCFKQACIYNGLYNLAKRKGA